MIYDLTLELRPEMLVFPGYEGFEPNRLEDHGDNVPSRVTSRFSANAHQGTHVDAPLHFIEGGKTIERLDPKTLVGPAKVVDLREYRGEQITKDVLQDNASDIEEGDRVVLLTGDVDHNFDRDDFFEIASVLSPDGAEWLVERGVVLVANDFLTEPPTWEDRPVHNILLGAEIPIVEYISNVDTIADNDRVELIALPLLIPNFEAAPARVVARDLPE